MSDDTNTLTNDSADTGAEVGGMPAGGLYGSSVQPSIVLIGGKEEALGVAVGAAFAKSGLTGNAWNALTEDEREKVVAAEIDPAAPAAPAPGPKGKRAVRRQVTTQVVDPATTSTVQKTDVVDTEEADLPARVTLAAPYAFYDDENVLHSWLAGSVVEDAGDIALLIDRGAVFEAE